MPAPKTPGPQKKLTCNASPDLLRQARILAAARNISISYLLTTMIHESFARLPAPLQALTWPDSQPPSLIPQISTELNITPTTPPEEIPE